MIKENFDKSLNLYFTKLLKNFNDPSIIMDD